MPLSPETQEKLLNAKRRGENQTFGATQRTPSGPPDLRRPVSFNEAAREMADAETLFGQQMLALEANMRAALATLRTLQQARMRLFGVDPDVQAEVSEIEHAGGTFGVGPDGFFRNESSPSTTQPKNDGGSDGNVSG
jgi:hypothetical protein